MDYGDSGCKQLFYKIRQFSVVFFFRAHFFWPVYFEKHLARVFFLFRSLRNFISCAYFLEINYVCVFEAIELFHSNVTIAAVAVVIT